MKKMNLLPLLALIFWASGIFAQSDNKELVSMIKTNLVQSKEKIKQYAWIETTRTFMKGELKSTKQNQCYYSVDGQLTKVATGGTDQAKKPGGLRGKIVANKKEEMAEYIDKAMDKVKEYLPPNGEKIQQVYAAGKVSVQILVPNKQFKLSFPDYLQQGDTLAISVDKTTQKLISLYVSTYIDKPEEKVLFNVAYKDLPDGTQYPVTTTFAAGAKELIIVIENSGYKKGGGQ